MFMIFTVKEVTRKNHSRQYDVGALDLNAEEFEAILGRKALRLVCSLKNTHPLTFTVSHQNRRSLFNHNNLYYLQSHIFVGPIQSLELVSKIDQSLISAYNKKRFIY